MPSLAQADSLQLLAAVLAGTVLAFAAVALLAVWVVKRPPDAEPRGDEEEDTAKHVRWVVLFCYGSIFVLLVLAALLVWLSEFGAFSGLVPSNRLQPIPVLLTVVTFGLIAFVIFGIRVFTRPLGGLEGKDDGDSGTSATRATKDDKTARTIAERIRNKRVRAIVRYGYGSIFALIALAVLPFSLFEFSDITLWPNAPIQIVKTCLAADDSNKLGEGRQACAVDATQWAVNVGGAVQTVTRSIQTTPAGAETRQEEAILRWRAALKDAETKIENAIEKMQALSKEPQSLGSTLVETEEAIKDLQSAIPMNAPSDADPRQVETNRQWQAILKDAETKVQEAQALFQESEGGTKPLDEARIAVANLGKFTIDATYPVPAVYGGLVVPFYMVFIALVGGCIGMGRRLPEYHLRGAPGYKEHYQKTKALDPSLKRPLAPEEVRDRVVFQIMQAVSAPLLAIAAYAIFKTDDVASIVAIGFIAGFASEPILMQIRKFADRAAALFPLPATPGDASGGDKSGDKAAPQQDKATPDPDTAGKVANKAADDQMRKDKGD